MNEPTLNNEEQLTSLTPARKRWMMEQYQRLINLVPHGKHKRQKGTKGAFGKRKRLVSK